MNPAVQPYLHALTHLKRAPTRYGTAPRKPVLVLTVLELIAEGTVADKRFHANAELVGTFLENWRLLVMFNLCLGIHLWDYRLPSSVGLYIILT